MTSRIRPYPVRILELSTYLFKPEYEQVIIRSLPHLLKPLVIEPLCGFPDSVAMGNQTSSSVTIKEDITNVKINFFTHKLQTFE